MQSHSINNRALPTEKSWIPLGQSISFLLSKGRLVLLSLFLIVITALLTWVGFHFSIEFVDGFTASFFETPPDHTTIWGWVKHKGWLILTWLYFFLSRVVSFYLAFLLAYTLTCPGYVILSTAAEKIYAGEEYEMDEGLTLLGALKDIYEGIKIGCFGILVTVAALFANFIPVIGQMVVFLLYTYYSALMFLDYPASRRRWNLGKKIGWLRENFKHSFRLGVLPALVSLIPVFNIFLIAFLFPILTVHTTLNFTRLESIKKQYQRGNSNGTD